MSLPSHIKAVVPRNNKANVESVPLPKLRDDYILVRVKAVALNPTDWKHVGGFAGSDTTGTRVGCDYAGEVVEVGPKVTRAFKKGDRIAGFAHGSNESQKEDGAFAEYIVVKGDLQMMTPDNISDVEAATLGVGVSTCGQALYRSLKLPLPDNPSKEPIPLLVYGGSTASGLLAIQFAKLSGCTVVATSSPHNFDYLKSLGAAAVFDYRSPTVAADIKAFTDGKLRYALDCITTSDSGRICAAAMSDEGGLMTVLTKADEEAVKKANPKVKTAGTLAYSVIGEGFSKFSRDFPPMPEEYEFAKKFWALTRELLADGKLKVAKPIVNRGGEGLEGVLHGLDEMANERVSGGKLVYTL